MSDLWEAVARPKVANICVVASREGVPIEQWQAADGNHGGSGVVQRGRPVIVYRGFGSWGEAKDSLAAGRWLSKGMFTVRGEGETQMALDLDDVLKSSGIHRMRGTGFLGYIEADISGLPFRTFISEGSDNLQLDPNGTTGMLHPSTGLGIGIEGGIPLDRIRKVVALNDNNTTTEMSISQLRISIDMLNDREGWEPEVKDRPQTHRLVIVYGSKLKGKYHKANRNQDGAECGTPIDWQFSRALIKQGDLMAGFIMIKDYWSGKDFKVIGKPCPKCFEWAMYGNGRAAVLGYADNAVDYGKQIDFNVHPPKTHTNKGYYEREKALMDSGMPAGQLFASLGEVQRYVNSVLRDEGVKGVVTVMDYPIRGMAESQWTDVVGEKGNYWEPTKGYLAIGKPWEIMGTERIVLHELAHLIATYFPPRNPASHGDKFAEVHARLLQKYMGVGLAMYAAKATSGIVRGMAGIEPTDRAMAGRLVAGTATESDIISMIGKAGVGKWWWVLEPGHDPYAGVDAYAYEEETPDKYIEDFDLYGDGGLGAIALMLRGTCDYDPEADPDRAAIGDEAFELPDGWPIRLTECRYDAGGGWKTLRLSTMVTA